MKKLISLLTIFTIFSSSLFAFEWPQENNTSKTQTAYFGQERGNLINTSLISKEVEEVKASEGGRILLVISDSTDDNDFFPSTLGSSVILCHDDMLSTVYGNLDTDTITITEDQELIEKSTVLGTAGNTGWQDGQSALEFQILDLKNSTAINPKILLPRTTDELPLTTNSVYLKNKNDVYFDINTSKVYTAGVYQIYRTKNPVACPYKTSVYINEILLDSISFDILCSDGSVILAKGKRNYSSKEIYPKEKENLQLVGEISLSPGKTILGVELSDIANKTTRTNYKITVY